MGKQLLNETCWCEISFIDTVSSKIVDINERLYWGWFRFYKTYCTLLFGFICVFQIIGTIIVKLESYSYSSFVCLFTRERVKWDSNWDTVVGGKNVALRAYCPNIYSVHWDNFLKELDVWAKYFLLSICPQLATIFLFFLAKDEYFVPPTHQPRKWNA